MKEIFLKKEEEMIQITKCGSDKFERSEANVIQSFIVKDHTFICVLYKLMDREGGIVRLHNRVSDPGRWKHKELHHHPIWIFLRDFGDKKSSHS